MTDSRTGECYIVSYDHGGLVLWGYEHFVKHLRELLGWLDRHPRFKSGLDNEAWMYEWLGENQPAVLGELRAALTRYHGRLGIGSCTYGQPLAAFLLEESNVRQIAMGLKTVKERLGYELDIYSFSEHAAFVQLPQVLRQLGVRGALMRTHYLMYGYCPGFDVAMGWWEGPDGSRIACVPTYVKQERQVAGHRAHPQGPFGLTTEDTWILTRYPSAESAKPLDSFCERFAHIRPLVASRIDDSGLKREELVSELDGRSGYRWATLEEVFDEFPTPSEVMRPTSEDFGVRMPWGYRGNELFDLARAGEIAVLTAERLAAVVAWEGGVSAEATARHEAELEQAWKDLLVAQHHDIQIVGRAAGMGRERLFASLERSRGLVRELLKAQAPDQTDARDFVAFNPLPWEREEAGAVLPDGTGLEGPAKVPAMGFAPFRPNDEGATKVTGPRFETDEYRVSVDPAGGIASLSTADGREILRRGAQSGQLAGVIDGVECRSSGSVVVLRTVAGFRVEERGKVGPLPYVVTWLFPHRGRRIEYSVKVRFNGERIGEPATALSDSRSCFVHERKLRACFYPAVNAVNAMGIYDVPFGLCTTRRNYIEGNYWTALGDAEGGLAIFNRGTMGSCREESGALSVPLAFSTHYIWGDEVVCGEREWQMGLLPWRGAWAEADLHHHALEFAFPVVAVPGTLAEAWGGGLTIENPLVHMTALYTHGGHGYVRVYNGSDVEQSVVLPGECVRTDLKHEEVGRPVRTLRLGAWEIATVRLW